MGASPSVLHAKISNYGKERQARMETFEQERIERLAKHDGQRSDRLSRYSLPIDCCDLWLLTIGLTRAHYWLRTTGFLFTIGSLLAHYWLTLHSLLDVSYEDERIERHELHNSHLSEIEELHLKLAGFEAKIEAHIQRFEHGVSAPQGCDDLDQRLGYSLN